MHYSKLVTIIFLVFGLLTAMAQKNTDKLKAAALKQVFKDSKLAASNSTSNYSFVVKEEKLQITHTEDANLISLEGNVDFVHPVFYNDHIVINSGEIKYTSGKSVPNTKICGNYEVEDVFYSDAKVCSYRFNFLYEGTEVNVKSKTTYDDARYLTKIFFHDSYPIEEKVIHFTVPNNVDIELVEKNFDGFDIKKSITTEGSNKVYAYTVKSLKAMKSEGNSLGILYYYPHLVVVTKSYTTTSGHKPVLASLDDLYKWYASLVKEVKNDPASIKGEVNKLTANAKTPEDKIRAIYYWVQDNIKYIAFEDGIAGFKPEEAQQVYHNRFGDCKGMANLTATMLKAAGFDARLTWIGTKRIPYTYQLPSLAVDNHMICTVYDGDKQYILDPTEKYMPLGKHAERIQGKEILIENGDKYLIKKVPVTGADQNRIIQQETLSLQNNELKGQGQLTINGEAKKNILYFSDNAKQEDKKKIYDNLVVADYTNEDKVELSGIPIGDREKAMEMKYTYSLGNKVTRFEKDIYIDIDWNKRYKNLIMEDDRETDYYFNWKVDAKVVKKFKIPAGYRIIHLPQNLNKKHADFSFRITFENKAGEITYTNEIVITNGLIKKSDFPTWNTFVKELTEVYNDQIVISK